jgi:hypothetical protein
MRRQVVHQTRSTAGDTVRLLLTQLLNLANQHVYVRLLPDDDQVQLV